MASHRNGLVAIGGALALAAVLPSCQTSGPPPVRPDAVVLVKDHRIPDSYPWFSRFARHSYLHFRESPGEDWHVAEIPNPKDGVVLVPTTKEKVEASVRVGRRVRILRQISDSLGQTYARQIRKLVEGYDDSVYRPWPGPNSNTFVDTILRETEGVSGTLDHNAVGKDATWRLGRTAGGTGLEARSPLLGAAVGLREGVEVKVLGLTAGVGFWPLVVKVPFLPEFPPRPQAR